MDIERNAAILFNINIPPAPAAGMRIYQLDAASRDASTDETVIRNEQAYMLTKWLESGVFEAVERRWVGGWVGWCSHAFEPHASSSIIWTGLSLLLLLLLIYCARSRKELVLDHTVNDIVVLLSCVSVQHAVVYAAVQLPALEPDI